MKINVSLICLLLAAGAAGCRNSSSTQSASNSAANVMQVSDSQPAVIRHTASLAEQNMCDEQARKRFREDDSEIATHKSQYHLLSAYRSHYDPSTNVCYVRIDYSYREDSGAPAMSINVYDAFEGYWFATFYSPDGGSSKVFKGNCKVMLPRRSAMNCGSLHDFNALLDKYFGIAG